MNEAEVKNEATLSTDDLVLLIGQKEIWILEKDRKIAIYEKQVLDLMKRLSESKNTETRIKDLENSNQQLSNTNISLDRTITDLRNQNGSLAQERQALQNRILALEKDLTNLNNQILELKNQLSGKDNQINDLQGQLNVKYAEGKKRNKSKSSNP